MLQSTIIFAQQTVHVIDYWDTKKKVKMEEGNLVNGKKNGLWIHWKENGDTSLICEYKDGKKNGKYINWSFTIQGYRKYEGNYINDKKNGIWMEYALKSGNWQLYQKQEYTRSGDELKLQSWYPDGQQKSEENYKAELEHGLWIKWYKNGQKEQEGKFIEGKKEGTWIAWDEDGSKDKEEKFIDDEIQLSTHWFPNGRKSVKGKRENNVWMWTYWDEDGKKLEEGKFFKEDDKRIIFSWYNNGQKSSEKYYEKGRLIKEIKWKKNGELNN